MLLLLGWWRPRPPATTNGTRYDNRQDYAQRDHHRDARPEYERRDYRSDAGRTNQVEQSSPALTLEEMKKTMADFQSQIDKQARKARIDESAKSSRLPYGSANMAAARTSSVPDNPDDDELRHEHAFFALGATDLPCHMDSDEYSD